MVRYRKIGGGSLHIRIHGRIKIIKPNEIFDARPEEIPETFRDRIVPLEERERVAEKEKLNKESSPSKLQYFVKPREKARGYYDVVDRSGKIQNEKALRKDVAEALIVSLQE